MLSDPEGRRYGFRDFTLTAHDDWRSTRTFETYPTRFELEIPEAHLRLNVRAAFCDQELVTVLSKPAFWEGRCTVDGTLNGQPARGLAYVERSGFSDVDTLDQFFKQVGEEVRVYTLYTGSLGAPGSGADTYVGMMRHNARTIAEALGG